MNIIVFGSRDFGEPLTTGKLKREKSLWIAERNLLKNVLHFYKPSYIIQGFATGADRMARLWADKNNIPHSGDKYEADWDGLGRRAGPIRNELMITDNINKIDIAVKFDGGIGSKGMLKLCRSKKYNISVAECCLRDCTK